jgi:hypothetical protein
MSETLLLIGGAAGAVVTIAGFVVMFWRLFKRLEALTEGIMGKPAVTDLAGETVEKAIPSLQARVGKIEELLIGVADANARLVALEEWRTTHEDEFNQELVRRLLDMQQTAD